MPSHSSEFENKTLILGIGAQKSGTTWLYDYLCHRPDVYMHPLKEVHFFDGIYEAEMWPNVINNRLAKEKKLAARLEKYRSRGDKAKLELYEQVKERNRFYENPDLYMEHFRNNVGSCRAFGEITAEYSTLSAESFRIMSKIHPDVRFVLLLRDPVDRLWSQIKMLSKFERPGFEKKRSLAERVDTALSRERIIERSRYDTTLKNFLTHVPESRLFVGFFEELYCDASIQKLCAFLSLPFVPGDYGKLVNESRGQTPDRDQTLKIRARLSDTYDFFIERYGSALPQKWKDYPA